MKNKVVALLLAATMSLGCLAGCGNKQQDQSSEVKTSSQSQTQKESESVSTASTEEVVELEEKTIQIWMGGPGKQKDSDEVWEAFNEMLQEYVPNTTVEFTIIPFGEYYDEYSRMLASGEEVDLAWIGWNTKIDENIDDGNLMPLDDLLAEYGQGIVDTLGQDVMDFHRDTADGKIYYAVNWQGLLGNSYKIWMPTELVALAGEGWLEDTQAAVRKWWDEEDSGENLNAVFDQFEIYFAACKEAGKLYSGIKPANFLYAWGGNNGTNRNIGGKNQVGVLRTPENKIEVIDGVKSESRRVYAQRMAEFYEKGYIRSDIASVDASTLNFVTNGEYNDNTVVVWQHNVLTETAEQTQSLKAGVECSFIDREAYPTLTKGNASAMSVPYCADEPERAIMVLDALYTVPELYQLLIYGIEGKHYTDNGDGTITTPYGAEGTADSDYGLNRWTIGTCMNSLVTQNDVPTYYSDLKAGEENAYVNPFIEFSFDKSNVVDICAALDAVDTVYQKLVDNCQAGADIEKALEDWIKEREEAGVDKLMEEYERQLNAFIAEKNITSW